MKYIFTAAVAAAVASAQGWRGGPPPQARGYGYQQQQSYGRRGGYGAPARRAPQPKLGLPNGYPEPNQRIPDAYGIYGGGPGRQVNYFDGPGRKPTLADGPVRGGPGLRGGKQGYAGVKRRAPAPQQPPQLRFPQQVGPPPQRYQPEIPNAAEKVEEIVEKVEEVTDLWAGFNKLTIADFKEKVVDDKENVWVIGFISPSCGSCHTLAGDWRALQERKTIVNRKIKFGVVDVSVDANTEILDKFCGDVKIQYTPTVLLYGSDKSAPTEYAGDYSIDSIDTKACEFCDLEGFGPGELLKDLRSAKKQKEDEDEAAGIVKEETEEDKAKKEAIANGKQIVIVDDAMFAEAVASIKEEKEAAEEEEAEETAEEDETEDEDEDETEDEEETAEEDETEEEEPKKDKKKREKLDDDKPVVVSAAAELPSHIASFQKLADTVLAGDFDIKDPAEEVELLNLYANQGPRGGYGQGYGAGYQRVGAPKSYGNSNQRPGAAGPKSLPRPPQKSNGKLSYGRINKSGYGTQPGYQRESFSYSGYQAAPGAYRAGPPRRQGPPQRPPQQKRPGPTATKQFIRESPVAR